MCVITIHTTYGVESASEGILRGFPSQASEIMGHRNSLHQSPKDCWSTEVVLGLTSVDSSLSTQMVFFRSK